MSIGITFVADMTSMRHSFYVWFSMFLYVSFKGCTFPTNLAFPNSVRLLNHFQYLKIQITVVIYLNFAFPCISEGNFWRIVLLWGWLQCITDNILTIQGVQKKMSRSFCLISPLTNLLEGWDIIHWKGGIQSFVWSTKTFLYDIWEPRYKQIEMGYQISKCLNIAQS